MEGGAIALKKSNANLLLEKYFRVRGPSRGKKNGVGGEKRKQALAFEFGVAV